MWCVQNVSSSNERVYPSEKQTKRTEIGKRHIHLNQLIAKTQEKQNKDRILVVKITSSNKGRMDFKKRFIFSLIKNATKKERMLH